MRKKITYIIAAIICIVQFGILLYLAKTDSPTTDESVHLAAGYTYLTKHDFRFNPEHPVLLKEIAAVPLLFMRVTTPQDDKYWNKADNFYYDSWRENRAYGEEMVYGLGNNADKLIFWGRFPMILLTLILGWVIFIIGKSLWGDKGGLVAMALFSLDPTVLAHGHLITTDIGVTLGFLGTVWLFWKFLKSKNWVDLFAFGLVFGLTMLAKFTAILLLPALVLILAYYLWKNRAWKELIVYIPKFIVAACVMWFLIVFAYGATLKPMPKLSKVNDVKYLVYENGKQPSILNTEGGGGFYDFISKNDWPKYLLVPRDYFKGMAMVLAHTENGHWAFLLGEKSKTGWWYYFPILFLTKTPTVTIILSLIGLWFVMKKIKKEEIKVLIIAAGVFFFFAMMSKADIGVRHIMPVYPVLFILIGGLTTIKLAWKKWAIGGAFGLIGVEILFSWPNLIAFYNLPSGGQNNGYRIAADSNLDWGQDLYRIRDYMADNNINEAYVDYLWDSKLSLDYYGIKAIPLEQLTQQSTGYVVVGASARNNDQYSWVKKRRLVKQIKGTVFIYKLSGE